MLANRTNGLVKQTNRQYCQHEAGKQKSSTQRSQFTPSIGSTYRNRLFCPDPSSKKVGKIVRNHKFTKNMMKENEEQHPQSNEKSQKRKQRKFGVIKKRELNLTQPSYNPEKQRAQQERQEMGLTITVESQVYEQEHMQTPKFAGKHTSKQISRQYQLTSQTKQQLLPDCPPRQRRY